VPTGAEEELIHRFGRRYNLLVILGPTATGKTGLAVGLAGRLGGEILSADSRQVYRGMDLGTGKDLNEYIAEDVPYHLIDVFDPGEECSVFTYQRLFYRCFEQIIKRGKLPLMVGGTGLYLDAVIRGYHLPSVPENPELRKELEGQQMAALCRRLLSLCPQVHNTTDLRERKRLVRAIEIAEFTRAHCEDDQYHVPVFPLVLGVHCEREKLRHRIADRLEARLAAGMIDEVQALKKRGLSWERIDSFGLEYRYIGLYLRGQMNRGEMFATLNIRICQFAKRQMTWFRRMERYGVLIHWIKNTDVDETISLIARLTI